MIKKDYTAECLQVLNKIINKGKVLGRPTSAEVEKYSVDILVANPNWESSVIASVLSSPKEVYLKFFSQEEIDDPIFAWAVWWAVEKGIVKHYGPGGTMGWTLHRADAIYRHDVCVGSYSPFNPSSLMSHVNTIFKYADLTFSKAIEDMNKNIESIDEKRAELESEKQFAQLQSKIKWG